jgi:hypothetical protein
MNSGRRCRSHSLGFGRCWPEEWCRYWMARNSYWWSPYTCCRCACCRPRLAGCTSWGCRYTYLPVGRYNVPPTHNHRLNGTNSRRATLRRRCWWCRPGKCWSPDNCRRCTDSAWWPDILYPGYTRCVGCSRWNMSRRWLRGDNRRRPDRFGWSAWNKSRRLGNLRLDCCRSRWCHTCKVQRKHRVLRHCRWPRWRSRFHFGSGSWHCSRRFRP